MQYVSTIHMYMYIYIYIIYKQIFNICMCICIYIYTHINTLARIMVDLYINIYVKYVYTNT